VATESAVAVMSDVTEKQQKVIDNVRNALFRLQNVEPDLFARPVHFVEITRGLEQHKIMKAKRLIFSITGALPYQDPVAALREFCSDLVEIHDSGPQPVPAQAAQDGPKLSASQQKVVDSLRAATQRLQQLQPDLFVGPVKFSDFARGLEQHGIMASNKLIPSITGGLSYESPAAAVRDFCADLITIQKIEPKPPSERAAKGPKLSGAEKQAATQQKVVGNIRAALQRLRQVQPDLFAKPVRFKDLTRALGQHGIMARKKLVMSIKFGLRIEQPTDALREFCADLIKMHCGGGQSPNEEPEQADLHEEPEHAADVDPAEAADDDSEPAEDEDGEGSEVSQAAFDECDGVLRGVVARIGFDAALALLHGIKQDSSVSPPGAPKGQKRPRDDGAGAGTQHADGGPGHRSKKQFFASLKADELSDAEMAVRAAIFNFLDGWCAPRFPTMNDISNDEQFVAARRALLPRDCPVTFRAWADRRIGGEIELRAEGGQLLIGRRAEIPRWAMLGPGGACGAYVAGGAKRRREL